MTIEKTSSPIDYDYQYLANQLKLNIDAYDESTGFRKESKTGIYVFEAYLPHNIPSEESSFSIIYDLDKDLNFISKSLEGIIDASKKLISIRDNLKRNHSVEAISEFYDEKINLSSNVKLDSRSKAIEYLKIFASYFPSEI